MPYPPLHLSPCLSRVQAKELIEENVQKNKVMLFTKSHCPYSIKAKTVVGSILPQDKFTVMEVSGVQGMPGRIAMHVSS